MMKIIRVNIIIIKKIDKIIFLITKKMWKIIEKEEDQS